MTTPRNAVVVLLDSLNRHMLGCYGGGEFDTPNLDRFAARSVRFTRHYAGSLPCMPARHDLLCGALDFPWRPWGSIEIWEEPVTVPLRRAGVTTQLISDHPHLFETGGENYHCDFTGWDYERGHESDHWKTRPDPSWMGAPSFRRGPMPYDNSRGWFRGEADFPGPRTMAAAARWIEDNAGWHDRFLLFVDEFDPHEPFDTPEPYASRYDPDWTGPHLIWPPYVNGGVAKGVLDERQARQVRASYGAKLTMIDRWFGELLGAIDRHGLWDDTVVVVCTDHGHYLGEKDIWGKPGVPIYEPLGRIPLLVAWPGVAAGTCDALTTAVDIHATLLDLFEVEASHRVHGRSLVPLIDGTAAAVREHVLAGVWGREVHLVTAEAKYVRAPEHDNAPLSMWSNRWSTMPVHSEHEIRLPPPDHRATLATMPGTTIPVIRQPFEPGDFLPYWAYTEFDGNKLFRPDEDPTEERNLVSDASEAALRDQLADALREIEAPSDQLERLGLG
jgi:arylsulfatase A-like enzyme